MIKIVKHYRRIMAGLYRGHVLTGKEKQFTSRLAFFRLNNARDNDGILLVEQLKDYEYTVKCAAASNVIARNKKLCVKSYNPYISQIEERNGRSSIGVTLFKKVLNLLWHPSIRAIFNSFANDQIFSNSDLYKDQNKIAEEKARILNFLEATSVDNVLEIKVEDVYIGDLIYDTYLRFFHQPTLEKLNSDLETVIECALNVFYSFNDLVEKKNVKGLLNFYSSYVHHGIPVRICLKKGIDVFTLGSWSYIMQKLRLDFPYHTIDHTQFSPQKELDSEQLNLARKKLTSRFDGAIDPAAFYMRKTSFSKKSVNPELTALFAGARRNIVIYAHDFYDSPHINRMLQFRDLYQFLWQTLSRLTNLKDTNVYIKVHPNGIEGCREMTIDMVRSFNAEHFYILDEDVSNWQIIELRPDLICTARGTVGIEMAYFEIPTVALYDNLYYNFKFVHSCKNLDEYFSILKGEQVPKIDFDKNMIDSFYYQAYIEKIRGVENMLGVFRTWKGDSYQESYFEFIDEHSKMIFSDDFIQLYESGYSQLTNV